MQEQLEESHSLGWGCYFYKDLVQVTIHSYDHHLEVVFEQACFSAVREGRQEHEQDSACDFEW